jgi:hypothetical protein
VNTDDVWHLIGRARLSTRDPQDAEAVAAEAATLLATYPPEEIAACAQPLWDLMAISYRQDLWAAAYLINGGASDDGFDYFRGWLIAQGRQTFEAVLDDVDSLADLPPVILAAQTGDELESESILSVVWTAYRRATGANLPPGTFRITYPELEPGWDFDDDSEMFDRLPRLAELFLT